MYPCKVGSAWEVFAPAKLNLYLEVLGPRPDGFHELETLMVPVRIYDHLQWTDCTFGAGQCSFRLRQLPSAGSVPLGSEANLVRRAAELLARDAGVVPRGQFDLTKRIPIQAGMGGGSSDAAATLLLANAAWKLNYSPERLAGLAAQLGSDVPFFLTARPAICRGRGEQIEPVGGFPRLNFVVVKPDRGLSTAEVFDSLDVESARSTRGSARQLAQLQLAQLVDALRRGALADAGRWMTNRLEAASRQLSPWTERLQQAFAQGNFLGHLMTGSGSAYFGLMRSAVHARTAARTLSGMNLGNVFFTSSG